jgi:hypothetical protein
MVLADRGGMACLLIVAGGSNTWTCAVQRLNGIY